MALQRNGFEPGPCGTVRTTLYDVIETVAEILRPGEELLVAPVVHQLLDDHGARFDRGGRSGLPGFRGNSSLCRRMP